MNVHYDFNTKLKKKLYRVVKKAFENTTNTESI